eukprot:13769804-Alexandrium_andersonii.AAC.1
MPRGRPPSTARPPLAGPRPAGRSTRPPPRPTSHEGDRGTAGPARQAPPRGPPPRRQCRFQTGPHR